jgi:hypothetical protein
MKKNSRGKGQNSADSEKEPLHVCAFGAERW